MNSQSNKGFAYCNADVYPHVGDLVRFLHEADVLVVEDVIDSDEKQMRWNVDEPGLMLKGGRYGFVFTKDINAELELVDPATGES